jgi:serine/threonine protein phosphatase PrpC
VAQAFEQVDTELLHLMAGQGPAGDAGGTAGASVPDMTSNGVQWDQLTPHLNPITKQTPQGSELQHNQQLPGTQQEAGSTAVMAILWGRATPANSSVANKGSKTQTDSRSTQATQLLVANVGNSRAVLCRKSQATSVPDHTHNPDVTPGAEQGKQRSGAETQACERAARRRQLRQERQFQAHALGTEHQPTIQHAHAETVVDSAHSSGQDTAEPQQVVAAGWGQVAIQDRTGNALEAVLLTEDHEVSNPAEAARIRAAGGSITTAPGGHEMPATDKHR